MKREPLSNDDAKRLIASILASGKVTLTPHFYRARLADKLSEQEVRAALRSSFVEFSEFEGGEWRYRARARAMVVVVAFKSEVELVVVTVWRA